MNTNDDYKPDLLERATDFLRNHSLKEIVVILVKSIVSSPDIDSSSPLERSQRAHVRGSVHAMREHDRMLKMRGITVTDVTMGYRYGNNPMVGRMHNGKRN